MSSQPVLQSAAPASARRPLHLLLVLPLAGLLVFYHLVMLYDLMAGRGLSSDGTYNAVQGILRLGIVASLIAVALGRRTGLWLMWATIGALIATHYWAHFGGIPNEFSGSRSPLSYLKGLIIPTIITATFLLPRPRLNTRPI